MPNATPDAGTSASANAPATGSPEIEALRKELNASFEKRIAGFQRLVSERDNVIQQLTGQLEDLQQAALSPDERVAAAQRKLAEENARLKAELELNALQGEYGDTLDLYKNLLAAGSAKDQLELLKGLSKPSAPATGGTEDGVEVPDVDPNNPKRTPEAGIRLDDGTLLTDSIADRILGSVGKMADVTQRGARSFGQSAQGE